MSKFEHSIDVNVPVNVAYNQWTQFEEFPKFMEGVEFVQQLADNKLLWRAEIAGNDVEWYAEITEQIPDTRIAWTSTSGAHNAGVVTFHYISEDTTRVTLQIEYEPEGFIESVGDAIGIVKARMMGDMERFKSFIEERDKATGSWRGTIEHS